MSEVKCLKRKWKVKREIGGNLIVKERGAFRSFSYDYLTKTRRATRKNLSRSLRGVVSRAEDLFYIPWKRSRRRVRDIKGDDGSDDEMVLERCTTPNENQGHPSDPDYLTRQCGL